MAKTASLSRTQIEEQIRKKQFAPIYLLMGEEAYYIDRLADMILKYSLSEEERDFNLTTFYGADARMSAYRSSISYDGRATSSVSKRSASG